LTEVAGAEPLSSITRPAIRRLFTNVGFALRVRQRFEVLDVEQHLRLAVVFGD
jgi:hypothetical protein